ncbi:Gfo/Idh/MocA family oxidoreductase [Nocardioides nanhaiensis]|uniref:Gfo/Idh/MocA family oxidoreductase n=1 Tax=Nocardioides nanhaiensis TaxID=1476871 RepID=A0ABP8W5E6_9ACTN
MSGTDGTRLRTAVVGLGWWGQKIVRSLADSDRIDVVVGVEPSADVAALVSRDTGLDTVGSLADAVGRGDLEAVVLCSPHPWHAEQVVAAAEAGLHVFCEKPFTVSSEEARRALAAVTAAGVQVGLGHERRFEPAVVDLRALVASGGLGVPLVFEGNFSQDKFLSLPPDNWRLSSELAPVGPLSATGIHLVDLAISIFGRPHEVWARLGTLATGFANGDTLSVTMGFPSGATASITAILTTPFVGRVAVFGSQGWQEIRDRSHPEEPTGWDVTTQIRGSAPATGRVDPYDAVRRNLECFADAIRGGASYPISAEEIQTNVDTFEAISRSTHSGRIENV